MGQLFLVSKHWLILVMFIYLNTKNTNIFTNITNEIITMIHL